MNFKGLNLSLETLTGGKNTLIRDDLNVPSLMVRIPRFNIGDVITGGPDTPHPMFIIDGDVKDEIFIGKHLAYINKERAYSLAGKDPANYLTLKDAIKFSLNKGNGWHVMTNADRAGIALLCKANGYFPIGNTDNGRSFNNKLFRGKVGVTGNKNNFRVNDNITFQVMLRTVTLVFH